LGARPRDIHRLVIAEGLAPVAAGVVAGLALSWVGGRTIGSLLFGVRPGDPAVMAAGAALVAAAALVACVGPARRAAGAGFLRR
ncbi:MAG TPA: FtsX-like permease family protein, partial [Vicinamibacterales bacterium]|nr:FtsX-like permease family protein [Vicinamibacterales bacterium]